jgi:iron complex outermembrane receptor protein
MHFSKYALLLSLIGLLEPISAISQDRISFDALPTLPDVTVQASRFEEKATLALPQTSVVSAEEISNSGAVTVSDILSKVVGLATRINLDGSSNAVVDMRGYGDTADNNVVILLDGVRISENEQASARTSMIPVEIIDHIEVTQGGNGVLYGDGATGGTINIVTKKNISNVTVVSGGLSSFSGYQSSFFHAREIGPSQVSIFGKGFNSDGYRLGASTNERSAGVNWITTIDARGVVGVRLLNSQEKNTLPGPLPSVWLNAAPTRSEVPGYRYGSNTNTSSITLFGNKKIDDVELSLDLSRREKSNDSSWRYNAIDVFTGYSPTLSPAPFDPFFPQPAPVNTYSFGVNQSKGSTNILNPRVKISEFLRSGNVLVLGVDNSLTRRSINADLTNAYTPDTVDNSVSQVHFKTQSFYFRDDWQITPEDRFTVGYRSQNYSESNAGTSTWYSSGSASANEYQYTKMLSASMVGYVRSSRNFRLPNVDDNNSVNTPSPSYTPIRLVPQTSNDIDIGLNYQFVKLRGELKIFRSNVHNEIAYDPGASDGYGGNVNYAPTRREGVSIRQHLQMANDWDVRLNLHYVKATFTQSQYAGNLVPNTARINGNFAVGYRFDADQRLTFTTRFSSDKFASGDYLNTQERISGYTVHDLGYFYRHEKITFTGSVNNILNKQYTDLGIYKPYNSGDGYYYIPPYNLTVYPNPGRNFSLVGRYTF